ncbi:MAG: hypothetical protein ILN61_03475 [Lachnospiraceae bacterium]|nr:hypothetical protein [Lachnospiraceae bacterium]
MGINKSKVLRGDPIVINEKITLRQPTINEIIDFDEDRFFGIFWSMCSSAYDRPAMFDDMGIDFMTVSDWQYFLSVIQVMDKESTCLIFGDFDFTEFTLQKRVNDREELEYVLYREMDGYIFDESVYNEVIPYVREMINFHHSGKKAANKSTAKLLIMDDRRARDRNKNKEPESMLDGIIISLVNTEEFSYTYKEAYEITIYQLMKSFTQICGKKSAVALMQGSMSGFMDTSGIDSKAFDWTYSEEKYKPKGKKLITKTVKKK